MWPFPKKSVMSERHKDLINGNIVQLSRTTKNLKELLKRLELVEVLNLYELAVINKAPSNSEKCFKLYHRLLQKDASTFKKLVVALLKTGNVELAQFLWEDDGTLTALVEEGERNRRQSIENVANTMSRAAPTTGRPQTRTSIIISVMVLLLTASVPFSIGLYVFKTWIDKISNND